MKLYLKADSWADWPLKCISLFFVVFQRFPQWIYYNLCMCSLRVTFGTEECCAHCREACWNFSAVEVDLKNSSVQGIHPNIQVNRIAHYSCVPVKWCSHLKQSRHPIFRIDFCIQLGYMIRGICAFHWKKDIQQIRKHGLLHILGKVQLCYI